VGHALDALRFVADVLRDLGEQLAERLHRLGLVGAGALRLLALDTLVFVAPGQPGRLSIFRVGCRRASPSLWIISRRRSWRPAVLDSSCWRALETSFSLAASLAPSALRALPLVEAHLAGAFRPSARAGEIEAVRRAPWASSGELLTVRQARRRRPCSRGDAAWRGSLGRGSSNGLRSASAFFAAPGRRWRGGAKRRHCLGAACAWSFASAGRPRAAFDRRRAWP
jgi:hypothetical protein